MRCLFTALFLMASPAAFAAEYIFDKVHTQIFFSASHAGFTTSTGAFTKFDGRFSFDEDDFSQSDIEVTIKTSSIDLNDKTWNKHMMGAKWFDAKQYPEMVFKSTEVKKTGDKTLDIVGNLTLKGVTKPVTLKATFNKAGVQFGKQKVGFSAVTTIDRTQFGMDYAVPAIGTQIPIRIEVEGVKML